MSAPIDDREVAFRSVGIGGIGSKQSIDAHGLELAFGVRDPISKGSGVRREEGGDDLIAPSVRVPDWTTERLDPIAGTAALLAVEAVDHPCPESNARVAFSTPSIPRPSLSGHQRHRHRPPLARSTASFSAIIRSSSGPCFGWRCRSSRPTPGSPSRPGADRRRVPGPAARRRRPHPHASVFRRGGYS